MATILGLIQGLKLYRHKFISMGCPCEIGVFSPDSDQARLAIADAEKEVQRLDRKYSHFNGDSYISRLESLASRPGGAKVDTETSALLNYAATQFQISDGLFDITAGYLTRLWRDRDDLPSPAELDSALELTGWEKLEWTGSNLTVPAGMRLELGGLVKEYAADRAALLLKRRTLNSAFVELGGDIHVTGPLPDGSPWHMGIYKPKYHEKDRQEAMASIPLSSGGLATSGDYERSCRIEGKLYGHIINPQSGFPVESFQSVSVLAPSCLLAGSMSTLAMLKGLKPGLELLRNSGLAWLVRQPDGVIVTDSDVQDSPNQVV